MQYKNVGGYIRRFVSGIRNSKCTHCNRVGTGFGLEVNKNLSAHSKGAALQNCLIRPTASTRAIRSVEKGYQNEKRTAFIKIRNRSGIVVLSK